MISRAVWDKYSTQLQRLRRVLSVLIVGAVGYLIFRTFLSNWRQVQNYDLTPNLLTVLATLLFVVAVMVSGSLWGQILERLTQRPVNRWQAIQAHIGSWLLKYVPGQVGSFAGKVNWGSKQGYKRSDITLSFIYENIFLVTSSLITTVPILLLLFLDRLSGNWAQLIPILVGVPLFMLSFRPIFQRLVNIVLRLINKPALPAGYFLEFGEILLQQLKFMLPRVLNAVGFVLIVGSVIQISPIMYLGLGATYILAGIIGILALFVPSGIGIREGVIILFASFYFPLEIAILVAILARLYATAADALLGVLYYGIRKIIAN